MRKIIFTLLMVVTAFLLSSCSRKVVSDLQYVELHDTVMLTVTDTVKVTEVVNSDVQHHSGKETVREIVKTIVLSTAGDTLHTDTKEKEMVQIYDSLLSLKDMQIETLEKYASDLYATYAKREKEIKETVKQPSMSWQDYAFFILAGLAFCYTTYRYIMDKIK